MNREVFNQPPPPYIETEDNSSSLSYNSLSNNPINLPNDTIVNLPSYEEAVYGSTTQHNNQNQQPLQSWTSNQNFSQATVVPYQNFVVQRDVFKIRAALLSFDKTILIDILCQRSEIQRRDIAELFKKLNGRPLAKKIKNEISTSSNFSILICGLVMPLYEFMARAIHNSHNFKWMCDIIFLLSNHQRDLMKEYFLSKYKHDIFQYIKIKIDATKECTSLNHSAKIIQKQINRVVDAERASEYEATNDTEVKTDLNNLLAVYRDNNTKDLAISMFYEKSFVHIAIVVRAFEQTTQIASEKFVNRTFGDDAFVINNIIQYSLSPPRYFANILINCLDGLLVNGLLLTCVVMMRCEIDMVEIKRIFLMVKGKPLRECIRNNTSGRYKNALLKLIGED